MQYSVSVCMVYWLRKPDFMQLQEIFSCLSEPDVISWFYFILCQRTIRKWANTKQKRRIFLSENSEIVWNIVLPHASASKPTRCPRRQNWRKFSCCWWGDKCVSSISSDSRLSRAQWETSIAKQRKRSYRNYTSVISANEAFKSCLF